MANFKLTLDAKDDLYRIWLYGLEHYGLGRTDEYLDALERHFQSLLQNPYQYAAVDDIREGYRRSVCGEESIYYRIAGDTLEIIRILSRQHLTQIIETP